MIPLAGARRVPLELGHGAAAALEVVHPERVERAGRVGGGSVAVLGGALVVPAVVDAARRRSRAARRRRP